MDSFTSWPWSQTVELHWRFLGARKKLWTYISKLYHGELKWCTMAESQEKEDDTQVQDGDYELVLLPSREGMSQSALQGVKELYSR